MSTMQNIINNGGENQTQAISGEQTGATMESIGEVVTGAEGQAATAVIEAPAAVEAAPGTETAGDAAATIIEEAVVEAPKALTYTRQDLMDARVFTLKVKESYKRGGFGLKSGPFIRDTVGYKFDSMDIKSMLEAMAAEDFLTRYAATIEKWKTGVKTDDSDTGKANIEKAKAAMALASDPEAFKKLVHSLRILCDRNQSWMENGSHVALPYNGHKAVLDLFGINVTNSRRLRLTAGF